MIVDPVAGTVRYTPNANFHGTDTYTYTVTSNGLTETTTVTVTVGGTDDPATFGGATSGSGPEEDEALAQEPVVHRVVEVAAEWLGAARRGENQVGHGSPSRPKVPNSSSGSGRPRGPAEIHPYARH